MKFSKLIITLIISNLLSIDSNRVFLSQIKKIENKAKEQIGNSINENIKIENNESPSSATSNESNENKPEPLNKYKTEDSINLKDFEIDSKEENNNDISEDLNLPVEQFFKNSRYLKIYQNLLYEIPESEKYIIEGKCEKEEKKEQKQENKYNKFEHKSINQITSSEDPWTLKEVGFGESSYFFDFLESSLLNDILDDFKTTFLNAMKVVPVRHCKPIEQYQNLTDNRGITYCQLYTILKQFKWESKFDADELFDKFDYDKDGVLNVREYILMAIETTKHLFGRNRLTCSNCFNKSIKKIKELFKYFDTCNTNRINSTDIWNGLQYIELDDDEPHNIFACSINNYRSPSVNDFILKSSTQTLGNELDTETFIEGILLGYWNRQVTYHKILNDSSRSLSDRRWINNKDFVCEKIAESNDNKNLHI